MHSEKLTVPNLITTLRILGTIALLIPEPFTVPFFVIYTLCGITDILDGTIARLTKSTSQFGAKLDSVADLLFYGVMIIKIFPTLWKRLPFKIWIFVAVIVLIRISAYLVAAFKYHRFASLHTLTNKLTGLMVFAIPYAINLSIAVVFCFTAASVAFIASAEELLIHIRNKEYLQSQKTVLQKNL